MLLKLALISCPLDGLGPIETITRTANKICKNKKAYSSFEEYMRLMLFHLGVEKQRSKIGINRHTSIVIGRIWICFNS